MSYQKYAQVVFVIVVFCGALFGVGWLVPSTFSSAPEPTIQTVEFKCPESVNVGITNRPADWLSSDKKISFRKAYIGSDQKGTVVTCEYQSDDALIRFMPGYKCQAAGPTSPLVSCTKKPKPPIKIN